MMVRQIVALIYTYPHFFLLPQKETLAKKRGHRNMLPFAPAGARSHFRGASAASPLSVGDASALNNMRNFLKPSPFSE
jgi:hypothetical protein